MTKIPTISTTNGLLKYAARRSIGCVLYTSLNPARTLMIRCLRSFFFVKNFRFAVFSSSMGGGSASHSLSNRTIPLLLSLGIHLLLDSLLVDL